MIIIKQLGIHYNVSKIFKNNEYIITLNKQPDEKLMEYKKNLEKILLKEFDKNIKEQELTKILNEEIKFIKNDVTNLYYDSRSSILEYNIWQKMNEINNKNLPVVHKIQEKICERIR